MTYGQKLKMQQILDRIDGMQSMTAIEDQFTAQAIAAGFTAEQCEGFLMGGGE